MYNRFVAMLLIANHKDLPTLLLNTTELFQCCMLKISKIYTKKWSSQITQVYRQFCPVYIRTDLYQCCVWQMTMIYWIYRHKLIYYDGSVSVLLVAKVLLPEELHIFKLVKLHYCLLPPPPPPFPPSHSPYGVILLLIRSTDHSKGSRVLMCTKQCSTFNECQSFS